MEDLFLEEPPINILGDHEPEDFAALDDALGHLEPHAATITGAADNFRSSNLARARSRLLDQLERNMVLANEIGDPFVIALIQAAESRLKQISQGAP